MAFSRAGNLADFLYPVGVKATSLTRHQLQVIHHQQVEATLQRKPARLAAHLDHALVGRIINVHRQVRQLTDGVDHPLLFVHGVQSQPKPVRVDARLRRKDAHRQLLTSSSPG